MSEVSDAMIVVVSEERGTISIAHQARLEVVGSAAELRRRLTGFLEGIAPEKHVSLGRRLFTRQLGLKLLSVVVAVVAWMLVFGYQGETVARTFNVPIAYRNVPAGWLLDEPRPLGARVTLSGSSRAFDVMRPSKLTIALDVGNIHAGAQRIALTDSDLTHPADLDVHRIEPSQVTVVAQHLTVVSLRVLPKTTGHLPHGVSFRGLKVEPSHVKVLLKRSDRGRVTSITTEPLDLGNVDRTTDFSRGLILPRDARLADGAPDKVNVTVEIARPGKP
jgi:YbbR domain-containing protein